MSEVKEQVLKKLKQELVDQISVNDVNVDTISNDEPVFGPEGKLEMDSLDALELVVLLEKNFDIKLKAKASSTVIFKTFDSLGDYIMEHTPEEKLNQYIK